MLIKTRFRFSSPAYYAITVSHEIDNCTRDKIMNFILGDPEFLHDETGYSVGGLFKDQAALSGLLNTLYNQHYIIVSVKRIENEIIENI